ncbi:MAG TPA: exodeoxyribonuclease VII large subunit [Clostridia bacterium]|nr:exodeoxyribonuclease VII large subunit [Clostridia bacterium]
MSRSIFSIQQINNYVKGLMDRDPILQRIWIRGEISNFKLHSSGHMYFTLKDDKARIRCVFFKHYGASLNFLPEDGMNVILRGNISIYSKDGQYQFYVEHMERDGVGQLYVDLENLKKKLMDEGLFNDDYKKPIPVFPNKIGVITSHTGAAVQDIIKVITTRNTRVNIIVIPVSVQGASAKDQISAAIDFANTRDDIDLLIIGRGGGSIEELWAFNEEKVARAIFRSTIPIISAVGHETDFTISDLVADVRAATPSSAGEMAVKETTQLHRDLDFLYKSLEDSISDYLNALASQLEGFENNYIMKFPERLFTMDEQRLDYSREKLMNNMDNIVAQKSDNFIRLASHLEALNPLSIMMRGFCFLTDVDEQRIIKSIDTLSVGEIAKIRLIDGVATCNIMDKDKVIRDDG